MPKEYETLAQPEFDYLFKILLVGESGVGKSSIMSRYCDDVFHESFLSTVGVDFKIKVVKKREKEVKLQIWDTAGQERYRAITNSFFRGAHGVLLCFNLTDLNSFLVLKNWMSDIKEQGPSDARIMLIGNKKDLAENDPLNAVKSDEALDFANKLNIQYFETSAKTGEGVDSVFDAIVEDIFESGTSERVLADEVTAQKQAPEKTCCS